jgi:hypothetical protein
VVEMATGKLKRQKPPDIDHIPAELIKAGSTAICSEIYKLINYIRDKVEMPVEWKESIIVPVYKKGDKANCRDYRAYHFRQLRTKFNPASCFQVHMQRKLLGVLQCGFRRNRSTARLHSSNT